MDLSPYRLPAEGDSPILRPSSVIHEEYALWPRELRQFPVNGYAVPSRLASGDLGNDEGLAVLAAQETVGGLGMVADEALRVGVDLQ